MRRTCCFERAPLQPCRKQAENLLLERARLQPCRKRQYINVGFSRGGMFFRPFARHSPFSRPDESNGLLPSSETVSSPPSGLFPQLAEDSSQNFARICRLFPGRGLA